MASSVGAVTEQKTQDALGTPKEFAMSLGSGSASAGRQKAWIAFLDSIAAREPDHDFMSERPMNRLPAERDLFAGD